MVRRPLLFILMIITIVVPFGFGAHAAALDDVQVPDTQQVNGKTLYLNGFGRRTFSALGIRIYIASLYLEHFNSNPDAIIRSPETKLLVIKFERGVSAEDARSTWRKNLDLSCTAPCRLNPEDIEKFLFGIPAMHAGDVFHLLFKAGAAIVDVNGHQIGMIPKPQFAEAMLASFLGPNTDLPKLRQELLTQKPLTSANADFASQRASGNRDR